MIVKILIIIIVGFILYNISKNKTEKLENVDPKMELAKEIVKKFTETEDLQYVDYLNTLQANNNTSYQLIKQDTFFEIKFLFKNKQLSLGKIIEYMSDVR